MEKWKPVPGYEGYYEVSDQGRFKALERTIVRKDGAKVRYKEKIIALDYGKKDGYPCVHLCRDCKPSVYNAHRIIAECFVPNPRGCKFINHKDGNKKNCAASNLEWVTASENAEHAYRVLGRKPPRLGTCGTRFTPDQIRAIRKDQRKVTEIAKEHGVTRESIYNIKKRKTYSIIED